MKYLYLSLLFILSFFFISADKKQDLSKESLIKDIDDYANKIIRNHAHPFNYIKKEQFLDSIKVFKEKAPGMNIDELQVGYTRINALLLDPHTSLDFPREKSIPIIVSLFDDGTFVTATSIKHVRHLGSRVIAMNDIPIDTVLKKMQCLIGALNPSWVKHNLPGLLFNVSMLYGMHLIDNKDSVAITFVSETDTTRQMVSTENEYSFELQSYKPAAHMLRMGNSQNYWYQYLEDKKSLYIQYRSCHEITDKPFAKFQENVMAEIHKQKPERIIIDVRANSGGLVNVFNPLIKALARDSISRLAKSSVLISRKTFSAAIWNTFELKNQLQATLIGEETGGDLNHPGAVVNFTLKHSKLKVYYSKYDFYLDARVKGGILPDITVPHTFANYKKGVDPDLEKALTY